MIDGAQTLTKENVSNQYVEAAKKGRIDLMMKIDESPLSACIPREIRTWAVQKILKHAPYPILLNYLHNPIEGINDEMRGVFFNYAREQKLVQDTPTFKPSASKQLNPVRK